MCSSEECLYPCVYISCSMAVKTITVSEDAYVALAALKKRGESFSDVIRRITKGNRSLLEFAGDWRDVPEATFREIEEFWAKGDELSKAKLRRLVRRGSE